MPDDDLLQILFETLPPGVVRAPAPVSAPPPSVAGLADVPTMDDSTEDSEPDTERTPPTVLATSGRARALIEPMIPPQRPRRSVGIRPNAALVKGIPSIPFEEPSVELPAPPVFQAPPKAAVVERVSVRTAPPRELEPLPTVEPTARQHAMEAAPPRVVPAAEARPPALSGRDEAPSSSAVQAVSAPKRQVPVAAPAGGAPSPAGAGGLGVVERPRAVSAAPVEAAKASPPRPVEAPRAAEAPRPEIIKKSVGRPVDSPRVRSSALDADFLDELDSPPSSPEPVAHRLAVMGAVVEPPAPAPSPASGFDWRAGAVLVSLGVVLCVLLLMALQQDLQAIR
jgi:hypothetical protein